MSVMDKPSLLYTLSPLAKSLDAALAEARTTIPAAASLAENQWDKIKTAMQKAVERGDLLMQRAGATLQLTHHSRRAAVDAEMSGVEITGTISSLSMPPGALKMLLDDADVRIPRLGKTLLSRDERQRLLIVASSTEFFPPATSTKPADVSSKARSNKHGQIWSRKKRP